MDGTGRAGVQQWMGLGEQGCSNGWDWESRGAAMDVTGRAGVQQWMGLGEQGCSNGWDWESRGAAMDGTGRAKAANSKLELQIKEFYEMRSPTHKKDLTSVRTQYEGMIMKNQRDAAKWFESKVEVLQNQITTSTTEVNTSQSQVTDLKRTFQSLEIELHGLLTQKGYLEQSVVDINGRHGSQLSQLQEELQQLNVSIQQASEYQILLDIKMRLEMEIAEYRRLLDGEGLSRHVETRQEIRKVIVVEKVQEVQQIQEVVEEYNPHMQKRVRVIVEEMVDGKMVSTSVDEKVQDMN
uniref:keratin, type I cytoskeletal 47 kDa-like n=1 Tax=Oncorhynchus gorbuscha TaxID=8017 RepID=UPI001EAF6C6E|nr:keratin, type I cytoskeletal 47 kDa-like [Oncorhynchus gorbuscha]